MNFVESTRGNVARGLGAVSVILWILVGPGFFPAGASEGGPLLLVPGEPVVGGDDPAPGSAEESFTVTDIQPRVGQDLPQSRPSREWDGWTKKGQIPARSASQTPADSQGSSGRSGQSAASPPPASLTLTPSATPVGSSPIAIVGPPVSGARLETPQNLPYPYGTPAPPPPLEQPRRSFLGLSLPRIFKTEGTARPSSLAEWWNSLWGKTPSSPVPANGPSGFAPGYPLPMTAGTGPVWNPAPGAGLPTPTVNPGTAQSWATQPRQQISAYVTPYALPPQQSGSAALTPPPLTASPQTANGPERTGVSGGINAGLTSQRPSGPATVTPGTGENGGFSEGWSVSTGMASPPAAGPPAPTAGQVPGPSAVPPGSGGVYLVTPDARAGPWTAWTTPGAAPYPTAQPTVLDRIRAWWADVTAPKGVQGRRMLLPPGGQAQPSIFGRAQTAPQADPFTIRAGPVSTLPPASSAGSFSGGSPAVLPPPSPQLPLRQAW